MTRSICTLLSPENAGMSPLPFTMVSRRLWSLSVVSLTVSMGGAPRPDLPSRKTPWHRAHDWRYTASPGESATVAGVATVDVSSDRHEATENPTEAMTRVARRRTSSTYTHRGILDSGQKSLWSASRRS